MSGIQHPAVRNRRTIVTKTVLCIQINIHGVTLHSMWQHNPVNNISHLRREILLILFLFLLLLIASSRVVWTFKFQDRIYILYFSTMEEILTWTLNMLCFKQFNPNVFIHGLVVRVSGCRYRGLGFDSRRYQIFWVAVGLERGPLSLVRSIEELLE